MLLVGSHFHTSRIRINDMCILCSVFKIIDQHIIQHTGFTILLTYFKIIIGNFRIEDTLRNIQFR